MGRHGDDTTSVCVCVYGVGREGMPERGGGECEVARTALLVQNILKLL